MVAVKVEPLPQAHLPYHAIHTQHTRCRIVYYVLSAHGHTHTHTHGQTHTHTHTHTHGHTTQGVVASCCTYAPLLLYSWAHGDSDDVGSSCTCER